jgi:phosphate transport system substrate-binding protein
MRSFGPFAVNPRRFAVLPLAILVITGAVEVQANEIKIGGTGAALGTMRLLLDAYAKSHPNVAGKVLPSLGSTGGIKAVLSGAINLAVAARPQKDKERAAGATAMKYATTALVPAVRASNPATGLSSGELLALYRGKSESWPDGQIVRLVLRPRNETDTKLLKKYIPAIEGAFESLRSNPAIPVAYTDQENAEAIERMPGSFGIVALSLIRSEGRRLKALALDGIVASATTIADGSYPLRKSFYLVTKGAQNPQVRGFIAFVRSAEGRAILRQTGHSPEQG